MLHNQLEKSSCSTSIVFNFEFEKTLLQLSGKAHHKAFLQQKSAFLIKTILMLKKLCQ